MQMLQSDWLSYSYTSSHRVQWLSVLYEMATLPRFLDILEERLDADGQLNS